MKTKLYIGLMVCLVLAGCRPRGVLSSSEMRDVLYDLHRTEAILQQAGYNYGHNEQVSKYYHQVLARHGVTQAQFDSSLVWYTAHPEFGERLYPRVISRLEAEIAAMEEEQRARDLVHDAQVVETEPLRDWEEVADECLHGWKLYWYQEPEKLDINPPFFEKNDEKE